MSSLHRFLLGWFVGFWIGVFGMGLACWAWEVLR